VLIFTRRIGEEIRIGNDIRVKIVDIKGKQVRLGIEAPPEVIVHREEIYLRINEDNNNSGEADKEAENWAGKNESKVIDRME
jgi:carbon storage regulator